MRKNMCKCKFFLLRNFPVKNKCVPPKAIPHDSSLSALILLHHSSLVHSEKGKPSIFRYPTHTSMQFLIRMSFLFSKSSYISKNPTWDHYENDGARSIKKLEHQQTLPMAEVIWLHKFPVKNIEVWLRELYILLQNTKYKISLIEGIIYFTSKYKI